MTSTRQTTPAAEPVVPASRTAMPGSEEYRAEAERRRPRSVSEIEADINATTERLTVHIDELVGRLSPGQIVRRGAGSVRTLVITADGKPRPEAVGAIVGALVGAAVLVVWSRRR